MSHLDGRMRRWASGGGSFGILDNSNTIVMAIHIHHNVYIAAQATEQLILIIVIIVIIVKPQSEHRPQRQQEEEASRTSWGKGGG